MREWRKRGIEVGRDGNVEEGEREIAQRDKGNREKRK